MVQQVQIPGIPNTLEFPDDATPEEITAAVNEIDRRLNPDLPAEEAETPNITRGEAADIAFGKGMTDVIRGIKRTIATISGDEDEAEAIKQQALREEETFQAVRDEFPVTSFLSEASGETAAAPFGGFGKTIIPRVLTSIGIGGGAAGIGEAGRGGDVGDIVTTAAIGSAASPVGEFVGDIASKVVGRGTRAAADDAANVVDGVELTRGDITQDPVIKQQESALRGADSEQGAIARAQRERATVQVEELKDRIIEDISRGATRRDNTDVGGAVQQSLTQRQSLEKIYTSQLYDTVEDIAGNIEPGSDNLAGDMLAAADVDDLIRTYAPDSPGFQNRIVKLLEDFEIKPTDSDRVSTEGLLGLNNAHIFRKRLNSLNPTSASERALIGELRTAFDDAYIKAINESGNEALQGAEQAARKSAQDTFKLFESGDVVDKIVAVNKKNLDAEALPVEQVVDAVLASGNRKTTNIRRVREALVGRGSTPETEAAWEALQADAMTRILAPSLKDGRINARALNREIERFGAEALDSMFSPGQIQAIKKYQGIVNTIDGSDLNALTKPKASQIQSAINDVLGAVAALRHGFIVRLAATNVAQAIEETATNMQVRAEVLEGIVSGSTAEQKQNLFARLLAAAATRNAAVKGAEPARDEINESLKGSGSL